MNWILKNKNKKVETLATVLFLTFSILLIDTPSVFAAPQNVRPCAGFNIEDTVEQKGVFPDGSSLCTCYTGLNKCEGLKSSSKAECTAFASQGTAGKPKYNYCTFQGNGNGGQSNNNPKGEIARNPNNPTGLAVSDMFSNIFVSGIRFILTQVQSVVGWLFAIAATLFAWAIEPSNVSGPNGILNKQAVKDIWTMVRDLLNMTFILVLLFAAFCTIFQVEKWNLKKVWLNILINALLVNFSYPIARFFIDVSNVAFYYFVNNLFSSTGTVTGSNIMAMFGASSSISEILQPASFASSAIAYQIAMIVFIFIMGMTLLIVAGLFLVRLIALTMLVMFSPIGFVGYIFPDTAKHADKWWSLLFSYSFFAPIMIFGIMISLRIADALKVENINSMIANASTNAPDDQIRWVSDMAFYFIPVIILWMFIGVAKSASIAGADTVVGAVKKGGKWLATHPALGFGGYAWKKSGIPGGVKKGMEDAKKSGKLFGSSTLGWFAKDGTEGRNAGIASVMGKKKGEGVFDAYKKAGNKAHNTELVEDVKKNMEKQETEETRMLTRHLRRADKLAEAMDPANRDKAVEYMGKFKQLQSDPTRKTEHEALVRSAAIRSARANPSIMGIGDASLKQAAIEAHVQKAIAKDWGDMKSNYRKVKKVHSK